MARSPAPGTRERILSTASRLFYEHGVRAIGMNQIITEAGTGKNLLYTHFPTKDDLVASYLQTSAERRLAASRRARDGDDDPAAQLIAIVEEVAAMVRRPGFRGCAFRNYLAEFPDGQDDGGDAERPTPAGVAHRFLVDTRAEIADLVARLPRSPESAGDDLTEQLWLIIDGLYQQAAYRDRLDLKVGDGADAGSDLARQIVLAHVRGDATR